MADETTIVPEEKKPTTALTIFERDDVKKKFADLFSDPSTAKAFVTTALSIVSQNDMLKVADPSSVYLAAVTAATLNLPINPNLGQAYILPYKDGKSGKTLAQFQIGYKGLIQLCHRSGKFKRIAVTPVYKDQIISQNPLTGYEFNWNVQTQGDPIGYVAYFALLHPSDPQSVGFEKMLYMSTEDLTKHGQRYSQSFKKGYGLRKDQFEMMAQKTVLKQLLSKYAPLSIEMEKAITYDQAVIKGDNEFEYPDADENALTEADLASKMEGMTAETPTVLDPNVESTDG